MVMPNGTKGWQLEPKVHYVCFVFAVVGLVCQALSTSFEDLIGKWSWWKLVLYVVVSCTICLAVWFSKAWTPFPSPQMKVNVSVCFMMITALYYHFIGRVLIEKPDAYSMVSSAAFAVMLLAFTRFSRVPLPLFCGFASLQLMKIEFWLVILSAIFTCCLFEFASTLERQVEPQPRNEDPPSPSSKNGGSCTVVLQEQEQDKGIASDR